MSRSLRFPLGSVMARVGWIALLAAPLALAQSVAGPEADSASSGSTPGLASLFPLRAPILAGAGSAASGPLARLLLPPEVLSSCRPDLSDLRILDPEGREVPYLVEAGHGPLTTFEVLETVRPEILAASQTTIDREGVPDLLRETYELTPPPPAPPGESWELVLESDRPRFVRKIAVTPAVRAAEGEESGGPEAAETQAREVVEGSIFRLPAAPSSSSRNRERLRLRLPADAVENLTVILEGEETTFLEPGFRFERSRRFPGRDRARVPLTELAVRSEGPRTTVELERPRGLVPDRLRLETATPAFSRRVEVWDEGPGAAETALGSGTLYRVPAVAPVQDVELPLRPAHGDRLRVVIHDGDSPPLEEPVFRAAVLRPALVFAVESPWGESSPGALLFGGARAYRPQYDVASLLTFVPVREAEHGADGPIAGAGVGVARTLLDPDRILAARLGETEPNPAYDPAPALAFAHRPGAPIDRGLYRYRRALDAVPSADGSSRLTLTTKDLARARADLADLRIVDPEDRQWSYLVEQGAQRALIELTVERLESERPGTSRYRIGLPARPATVDRLTLDSTASFFDRPYALLGLPHGADDSRERVLVRGRLQRRVGDPRPVNLAPEAARIDRLVLEIEDGDDAPLAIARAEGRFPLPELYFPVPRGEYALLLGNPDAEVPRYELSRARDLVLAVEAEPAWAGPLEENPAYRAGRRFLSGKGFQRLLLWTALGVAVLTLAFLTLRLARRG